MYLRSLSIFYLVAAVAVTVPILVTGKPQFQLWIGSPSESPKDDAPSQPTSVSTSEGGLKVIPENFLEKPAFTGYMQLQVFLRKTNDFVVELVKIHDSNSTFTIPKSFSSENARSRNDKTCVEGELLYEETGKCYRSGPVTQGVDSPCADEFMQFAQLSDKPGYGECFCLKFRGSSTRPVVYWEKSNRCYWLYDQGPCEKGQWLSFSKRPGSNGKQALACVIRTCPQNMVQEETMFAKFWFEHQGKCYQTGTSSSEFCGVGKEKLKIYFDNDKPEPICTDIKPLPTGVKGLASGVNFLSCKSGHKKLPNGDCKRTASFE